MLAFRLRVQMPPESCLEAVAVLRSMVGPVRTESGCLATRLLRDVDANGALTWVEEWRGLDDFRAHLQTSEFRRLLALMDRAAQRPSVEIDRVSERQGFGLVEKILGKIDAVAVCGHDRPDEDGRCDD